MTELNDDNIQDFIASNSGVVIQFGATWCMPCKVLKPKVEKISQEGSGVAFGYVDVDGGELFSQKMKVQAVPTVIGFYNGELIETLVGPNENGVRTLVEKIRNRANP